MAESFWPVLGFLSIVVIFTAVHLWAVAKHPEWFKDYNHWGDL